MHTRPHVLCLVAWLCCGIAGGASPLEKPAGPATMPEILWNPAWEHPFWVGTAAAVDNRGQLKPELFHSGRLHNLQQILDQPEVDGCLRIEEVYLDFVDMQPRGSVDAAIDSADLVIHARITGAAAGFDTGYPATLLRAEVRAIVKGSSPLSEVYFAWPVANFSFLGKRICKTDSRYAALPEVGDEIVAFVKKTLPENFPMLHLESPGDIILLRPAKIDYPSTMIGPTADHEGRTNPKTREELLGKLGLRETLK